MNEFVKLFIEASKDDKEVTKKDIKSLDEFTSKPNKSKDSDSKDLNESKYDDTPEDTSEDAEGDTNVDSEDNIEDESGDITGEDSTEDMGDESGDIEGESDGIDEPNEQLPEIDEETQLKVIGVYNNILSLQRTMSSITESLTNLTSYNIGKIYVVKAIDLSKQLTSVISKYLANYVNDGDLKTITKNYNSMYKTAMSILTVLKNNILKEEE